MHGPEETPDDRINLEDGPWYYFTVDLDFESFAAFKFVRYIQVNADRTGAIVDLLDQDYFHTRRLLLLPTTKEADDFKIPRDGILSVWTFDASKLGAAVAVNVQANWPRNILDKAAITPSLETAIQWTRKKR